jgi:chemotaxis protein methyltransferase WspC
MIDSRIQQHLNASMGLDVASIGALRLERALQARLAATVLDLERYWDLLRGSATETQELIEAVVVPETWFFRDRQVFTALLAQSREHRVRHPAQPLRILSLPCATGEEPFSIAMILLEARLPPAAFRIDAWDISLRALQFAARACYGKNSFRGEESHLYERHFTHTAAGYQLDRQVRDCVSFRHANILGPRNGATEPGYDIIFCRNLLIYFDRPQQQRAVRALASLLAPTGTLFTAASESAPVVSEGFEPARIKGIAAFRKSSAPAIVTSVHPDVTVRSPRARLRTVAFPTGLKTQHTPPPSVRQPSAAASRASESWMDAALRLADSGELDEAMRLCEAHLPLFSASAQAFYVKALLHDALGQPELAVTHYRKALYLDPSHHDALLQLGAALASAGELERAQRLFDRAARVGVSES